MAAEVEGQFAGVEMVLQRDNTRAFAGNRELGTGLLSVEESNLIWSSSDGSERLVLDYPSIVIHAISRDTSAFPHQCIYLQYLRQGSEGEEEGEGEGEDEGGEVTEYRLVPPSPEHLQGIYEAITHCQTLYPDPELSDSELDDWEGEEGEIDLEGGEFFTSAEGLNHLSPQGLATLSHLERILQPPGGSEVEDMLSNGDGTHDQFEDAD